MSGSPFAQAHAELSGLGFHAVIPIIPPSAHHHKGRGKSPGAFSAGGWQGLTGWTRYRETPPSRFEVGMWSRWPDAGAGLVLGTSAGQGLQVVAVDIDVADADDLRLIQSVLPASPMSKRGAKGLTLVYLASAGLSSRAYDRAAAPDRPAERLVDLLAGGRQTVVPGSVHPSTGQPYVWLTGPVPVTELPILNDGDIEKLEEVLETLGWSRDGRHDHPSEGAAPRAPLGEFDPLDPWSVAKAQGLARLDEWFPALNLPGARRARGGWEAVPVWRPSSTGRPLEQRKRNLSASSTGIRDWGAGGEEGGLTAVDVVQRALDISASDALIWLQDKLGLDDQDDGGVVIALHPPGPKAATPPAPPGGDVTGGAAGGLPDWGAAIMPDTAVAATHATELPAHLLEVPGLVGDLAGWIVATARKPQPVLALSAALAIVGTAAGRRYAGPTLSGTHLYLLGLAPTGAGKDHALDMAARVLRACEMGQHVGQGEFMSHQAIYQAMARQPLTLNPMDELGSFLGKVNSRKAAGSEKAITGVLRTAWGKSFKELPVPGWATMSVQPIMAPAFSILGASTHQDFFRALDGGDIDNGFLNRFLLFSTSVRPAAQRPTADPFNVPADIADRLIDIYQIAGPLAATTMHNGKCDRPVRVAAWHDGPGGELEQTHERFSAAMDHRSDEESFFARTAEQAIRLATIRAIGIDSNAPVIDAVGLQWAHDIALWSARRMLADAIEHMAENQTEADRKRVLRLIGKNQPISHRDLLRKLSSLKSRELEDIINVLKAAEQIAVEATTPPSGGKAVRWYSLRAAA